MNDRQLLVQELFNHIYSLKNDIYDQDEEDVITAMEIYSDINTDKILNVLSVDIKSICKEKFGIEISYIYINGYVGNCNILIPFEEIEGISFDYEEFVKFFDNLQNEILSEYTMEDIYIVLKPDVIEFVDRDRRKIDLFTFLKTGKQV